MSLRVLLLLALAAPLIADDYWFNGPVVVLELLSRAMEQAKSVDPLPVARALENGKFAGDTGEVYVVGVSPDRQGEGLGKAVTILGLDHLKARGLRDVILYVDEENLAAVRTYAGLAFTDREVHRQYARLP